MARRNFGARNTQTNMLLRNLERLTEPQAALLAAAWLAVPAEQRAELRREARQQLQAAPSIVAGFWSNARAFASDALRAAAYRSGLVHYSDMGDESTLPWGAARAAARDISAVWAVLPWLEPGLADALLAPGRSLFGYLRAR